MKSRFIILLIVGLNAHVAFCQSEITENLDFERIIENLLPQQELDLDYSDLYDRLFTLYSNPIDLNRGERTSFQSMFFLTEEQINGIISYRENYGEFLSIYELQSIDGFDRESIERLIPFVTIDHNPTQSLKSGIKAPKIHDLFLRYQTIFEEKKGYLPADTSDSGKIPSRYAGDPNRLYARYLYAKPGMYSFGFTIEKDPGELLIWDPETSRYGMDYYSFHAMIENRGVLKKLIIGDFSMDFGQGLIFGSGLSFGKGTEPITTIRRNNLGLKPYRSVFEDRDFSGIAVSTSIKNIELNAFYSHAKRDAIIREDSSDILEEFITMIQTIGLHRTPSEIAAKNNLTDQSAGMNINLKTLKDRLEVGINGVYSFYSLPKKPIARNYNQFDFNGFNNYVIGLYANYYLKKAHIFGEIANSKSGGRAISAGIIASLSSQVQTSLHYRNHGENFHSFYGAAFGENTKIANEKGIFWGIKILPLRKLTITSYLDLFSFPWLKYRVDKPSQGHDFMLSAIHQFSSKIRFHVQFRTKTKEWNFIEQESNQVNIFPKTTNRFLFDFDYSAIEKLSFHTRIQQSQVSFHGEKSRGFIVAQDLVVKQPRFTISARFSLFDSDNYDNRQFIYERDLLYVYNIPSFYNKGIRYYLLAKVNFSSRIEGWLKIAQTKYTNQNSIGSGLEEIDGSTKTNFNMQLRFKL